jgi:hypothetical protein
LAAPCPPGLCPLLFGGLYTWCLERAASYLSPKEENSSYGQTTTLLWHSSSTLHERTWSLTRSTSYLSFSRSWLPCSSVLDKSMLLYASEISFLFELSLCLISCLRFALVLRRHSTRDVTQLGFFRPYWELPGWPRQTSRRFLRFQNPPGSLPCFDAKFSGLARKGFWASDLKKKRVAHHSLMLGSDWPIIVQARLPALAHLRCSERSNAQQMQVLMCAPFFTMFHIHCNVHGEESFWPCLATSQGQPKP